MTAEQLRKIQKDLRLTNTELAQLLQCSVSLIEKMRRGTTPLQPWREKLLVSTMGLKNDRNNVDPKTNI